MTLGQIISSYRSENSLSMLEFANKCGISKAYVGILENNVNPKTNEPPKPSMDLISRVAKGMFLSMDEMMERLNDDSDTIWAFPKKSIKIPVLGEVAAGIPIEANEDILDYEEISEELARKGEFFGLKIKGDSMDPEIKNGDVVIVRKQDTAKSGDIVIAYVNGYDATCKRFVKYAEGVKLLPINPSYDPMFFSHKEVEEMPVKIVGKVVENRRKY